MVKSGLAQMPHVSHYRLAVHLGMALFCAMYVLWLALNILRPRSRGPHGLRKWGVAFLAVLVVQIIFGAFMAGTKAGYLYQTFPLMNGEFSDLGPEYFSGSPQHHRESVRLAVCPSHAWLVCTFGGLTLGFLGYVKADDHRQGRSFLWMGSISVLQFGLGVFLVIIPGIPISIGSIHQMGAFFLLSATVIMILLTAACCETRSAYHQLRQSGRLLNRREVAPLKLLECRFGQHFERVLDLGRRCEPILQTGRHKNGYINGMKPLLRDVLICIQRDLEIRAEVKPKDIVRQDLKLNRRRDVIPSILNAGRAKGLATNRCSGRRYRCGRVMGSVSVSTRTAPFRSGPSRPFSTRWRSKS